MTIPQVVFEEGFAYAVTEIIISKHPESPLSLTIDPHIPIGEDYQIVLQKIFVNDGDDVVTSEIISDPIVILAQE